MPSKSPLDSLSPTQRALVGILLLGVAAAVVAVRGCNTPPPGQQPAPGSTLANRNVRFGMPADAKADEQHRNAYLIDRPQYVLSYNDSTKNPNWVCWNITATDIGKATRGAFEPDPDLPKGFAKVKTSDYTGSGFDRGHMCASKDRSATDPDNDITFYMTNVVPQAPACNQGPWKDLEDYCRKLTEKGNELYIACGPHGRGGVNDRNERLLHIGKGKVQIEVPESVWKVVLVLPKDTMPTQTSRAIAVWMPNDHPKTDKTEWRQYVVTVAEVEQRTGYTFFPLVPPDLAGPIKSRRDTEP